MENNNQNQKQQRDNSGSVKKESTVRGGNDPPTSSSQPKDIILDDVCSICMENVSILNENTFTICSNCGKGMHMECHFKLRCTKSLSFRTRNSCPMCRAMKVDSGSKENIERLKKWTLRKKSWAQFLLGSLYERGLGVTKDPKRAFELNKLAADQGNHHAQYNIGIMHAEGLGVIQSDTLAFKYWKLSAEQGYANAQCNVGAYYADGKGVKQSNTKAREWYAKAVKQGHKGAIKNLKILDKYEGIKTPSSTAVNENLCSKCNKPAQTNRTLRNCKV